MLVSDRERGTDVIPTDTQVNRTMRMVSVLPFTLGCPAHVAMLSMGMSSSSACSRVVGAAGPLEVSGPGRSYEGSSVNESACQVVDRVGSAIKKKFASICLCGRVGQL
jgi:hypothetical protein